MYNLLNQTDNLAFMLSFLPGCCVNTRQTLLHISNIFEILGAPERSISIVLIVMVPAVDKVAVLS